MKLKSIYENLDFKHGQNHATPSSAKANADLNKSMKELDSYLAQKEREDEQEATKKNKLLKPRFDAVNTTADELSQQLDDLSKVSKAINI